MSGGGGGGGGRKRKGHEEEHENSERWLVTYADMLTVLMALFIVMFALSVADKTKFEKFAGFAGCVAALEGRGAGRGAGPASDRRSVETQCVQSREVGVDVPAGEAPFGLAGVESPGVRRQAHSELLPDLSVGVDGVQTWLSRHNRYGDLHTWRA